MSKEQHSKNIVYDVYNMTCDITGLRVYLNGIRHDVDIIISDCVRVSITDCEEFPTLQQF